MLREPIFNDPTYPKNKMNEIEKFIAKSTEREMGIKKMFPIKIKRTKKKVGRLLNKLTKKQ